MFDKTSVDFLDDIGVDFYKIASFELIDLLLIEYIVSKRKPIIMSTGMVSPGEIEDAVQTVRRKGNNQLVLLHCANAYTAITDEMNLKTMVNMKETFRVPVGLSDRFMGSVGAVAAVVMENILGQTALKDIKRGEPLDFSMIGTG